MGMFDYVIIRTECPFCNKMIKDNRPERENVANAISTPSSCSHVHNLGSQDVEEVADEQ